MTGRTRLHMGVEHARRYFMATLEPLADGCSDRFEAPAGCELWPCYPPAPLMIDGEPFIAVVWSITPAPLPAPVSRARQRHEQADAILKKRSAPRKAKRKSKR